MKWSWQDVVGAGAVVSSVVVLSGARFWRPDTTFTIAENVQIAEAQAWWQGRLDLPERKWDTALYNGKVYSHFPPLFSIVSAAVVPFSEGVPHWFVVAVLFLPVPVLSYLVMLWRTGSRAWGVLLAVGLTCGTSLLPVLDKTVRGVDPYFVNHTLATIGVLLMLHGGLNGGGVNGGWISRGGAWLSAVGLVIGAMSRQMTVFYALPLLVVNWQGKDRRDRLRRTLPIVAAVMIAIGIPTVLNALKFEHPFDSGYMHVYEGRHDDPFARDARMWGIFSPHYVLRNLYFSNLGFPDVHRIEMAGVPETYLRPNDWGTGIWWTTPLLLWLVVVGRRVWGDPSMRWWLVAAAVVYVSLLFYHSTGFRQRGFNRYSLDYIVVVMVLVAPYVMRGWRGWTSAAMIGWSVVYFAWLGGVNLRIY